MLIILCTLISILRGQNGKGVLTIRIVNLKNNHGQALVFLFRAEDKMPKNPFRQERAVIVNGNAVVTFENLPYREYAAIAVHDENSDGKVDHLLGFPNETLGFSNGWQLSIFSGMPSFEKLKFQFTQQNNVCKIDLQ
jgi:uncharacterized protein (DUF2141 family)